MILTGRMPKRERDEALSDLSSRVFSAMIEDIVLDVVLKAHQELARAKAVCSVCHTRCGIVHPSGSSSSSSQAIALSSSRQSPPDGNDNSEHNGSQENGTRTPLNGKSSEGGVYFECEVCKRQVASSRYANHLAGCMNIPGGRRGAARGVNAKPRYAPETGRSASPYVASESGNMSDDSKAALASGSKSKSRSKAKQKDEAEFSLNKKRMSSPSVSPVKSKKQKTSGSPASSRVKTEPGTPSNGLPNTQAKKPSKLRESAKHGRSTSPYSRSPSPIHSASTPTSTLSMNVKSPMLANAAVAKGKLKNGVKPKLPASLPKRPSPPRPPPPPVIRMAEPDYLVDVEGEETGSSTDTDSS